MRFPVAFLAFVAVFVSNAQVDINKMIQEKMAKQGQGTGQPGGSGVKLEDDNDPFVPNEFTGSFRMEMHRYKSTGEGTAVAYTEVKDSPSNLYYWSTTDMTLMRNDAAEKKGQDMKILTDLKGKWTYMLMTDEKGKKTAMKSRKKKMVADESTAKKKEPVITVTNETKEIEGHTCTKVIVVSEDGTWTGWVAKDVKAPFADMARSATQRAGDDQMRTIKGVDGMPLEFEWVSTDGKDRMVSYVRELSTGNVDASVFSLDGYEVMEMPAYVR